MGDYTFADILVPISVWMPKSVLSLWLILPGIIGLDREINEFTKRDPCDHFR